MLRYLLAALLITAMPASAESVDCRVIGIADGNTFSCRTNVGERFRVRMAEIDTPELKQPYGSQARQALSDHIFGKNVTLVVKGRDDPRSDPGASQRWQHRRQFGDGQVWHGLGVSRSP